MLLTYADMRRNVIINNRPADKMKQDFGDFTRNGYNMSMDAYT